MTVSYTCQKPIKFWAKCKINLLYKLNQSLLCVPGCPLLLATRLRTWAPFLLPLILYFPEYSQTLFLPGFMSCIIGHHLACSSLSLSSVLSLELPPRSLENYFICYSPVYFLAPPLPPAELVESLSPPSSIFLYWIQTVPSPFSNLLYLYVT